MHLRLREHFQNSLPPSTAGDASFVRIGSGEGLSEPVMEFPAVLDQGVFLIHATLGCCCLDWAIFPLRFTLAPCHGCQRFGVCPGLGCREWGCNKWGLKGCLAALPGNQPKSAEIALFLPFFALFRRVRRAPGKSRKRRKKAFFLRYPQICLNPHLLNPHLRHSNW